MMMMNVVDEFGERIPLLPQVPITTASSRIRKSKLIHHHPTVHDDDDSYTSFRLHGTGTNKLKNITISTSSSGTNSSNSTDKSTNGCPNLDSNNGTTTASRTSRKRNRHKRSDVLLYGWFRRIGRGLVDCYSITISNCQQRFGIIRSMSSSASKKINNNNHNKSTNGTELDNSFLCCVGIDMNHRHSLLNINPNPTEYYYEDESTEDVSDDDEDDDNSNYTNSSKNKNYSSNNPISMMQRSYSKKKKDFNYCTYGTKETSSVWCNTRDGAGTLMSCSVWILILYSAWTMALLGYNNHVSSIIVMLYWTICVLALACHVKTSTTDPGCIPYDAIPILNERSANEQLVLSEYPMCSTCRTYKPPLAHHCRICNRCISHMDHHCPWMNNCIGVHNFKHFILFLLYVWVGCTLALLIFAINYFGCTKPSCEFDSIEIQLVRIMTILCIGTLLFVSSMILNVMYGILTGVGTIDRMQKKIMHTWSIADEEPMYFHNIFGINTINDQTTTTTRSIIQIPFIVHWFLPTDPIFPDYEQLTHYTTYKRQQRRLKQFGKQQQQQQQLASASLTTRKVATSAGPTTTIAHTGPDESMTTDSAYVVAEETEQRSSISHTDGKKYDKEESRTLQPTIRHRADNNTASIITITTTSNDDDDEQDEFANDAHTLLQHLQHYRRTEKNNVLQQTEQYQPQL